MADIYYCQFLGDHWGPWEGGDMMPPIPGDFDPEATTITVASRDGNDWCHAYDPVAGLLTWCIWEGDGWSDWYDFASLAVPPNWLIDDEEAYFSVGARLGTQWLYSYNAEDGSIYYSAWVGDGYSDWEGPFFVEDEAPNMADETDVFFAGDSESEWIISVNPEDWSVFFAAWEGDGFGPWEQGPDLFIPEEWHDYGIDLDGDARDGAMWIYATVYDSED
ncbi:MAG: hypothetical protein CL920_00745 [Deltaproteobacteria bacterium]|nr:hypothetical protein [Deltaproteobacteria bacterium]MBU47209.1 hypothetical protein [Deltaproteobacteria bacterium]